MMFVLGYIAGVATCSFVAGVLVLLQKPLYQMAAPVVKAVENAGPRARGFVVEPEPESAIARREHVQKNAAEGRDTPIEELL